MSPFSAMAHRARAAISHTVPPRKGVSSPRRGTWSRKCWRSLVVQSRYKRRGLGERSGLIEEPDPEARGARMSCGEGAGVGAAHFEESLEPHIGEERGEMVGPIVEGRILARKPVEAAPRKSLNEAPATSI